MVFPRSKASNMRCRESLNELGCLLVPDYAARLHWYHKAIAEVLEGLLRFARFKGQRGGYARAVISMPPRHSKTLHGVELLPAQALGLDPDCKVMVVTNGASLAKSGVDNTRNYMQTDEYKRVFPTRVGKVENIDAEGNVIGKLETTSTALMFKTLRRRKGSSTLYEPGGGYYLAQGLGGSITGLGFELGILDDLIKNAQQAMSPAHHAMVWNFFTSTFDTRANNPWAAQLYIGTRWTEPDFADELIDHWRAEATAGFDLPVKELRLPALAVEPLEPGDPREIGEGLDKPSVKPVEFYLGKEAALMTRTPWVWDGLWQQRPSRSGMKFFQSDEWRPYDGRFELGRLDLIDFSIDAALAETGPSWTTISMFGVMIAGSDAREEVGEHYFLLDEARGHWPVETLYTEFERLWLKWHAELPAQMNFGTSTCQRNSIQPRVWVENKALGHSFNSRYQGTNIVPNTALSFDQLEIVRRNLYPVPKAHSKIYCYRTAGQITAMGRVWVPVDTWGEDPTNPALPLVTSEWVGRPHAKEPEKGTWVHEVGAHPSTPDDRRDTLAQEIICRTSWMGPEMLGRSSV